MSLTDAIVWTSTVLLFLVGVLFIEALVNVFACYLTSDGHKPRFKRMKKSAPWKTSHKPIGVLTKVSETDRGLEVKGRFYDDFSRSRSARIPGFAAGGHIKGPTTSANHTFISPGYLSYDNGVTWQVQELGE